MRLISFRGATVCLLVLLPAVVFSQKTKKGSEVAGAFLQARYVYVETMEGGDITQPGLYPPDRQAIADVQDGIQNWKRYTVCLQKNQADLVFRVRKERLADVQGHVGLSGGPRVPPGAPGQTRQPGQGPDQGLGEGPSGGDEIGVRAEGGPDVDMLQVFIANSNGKMVGPIWNREMKDGLDEPGMVLIQQLREAVERTANQQQNKKP